MYQSVRTYVIISQYDLMNVHNLLSQHLCDIDTSFIWFDSLLENPAMTLKQERGRGTKSDGTTRAALRHSHVATVFDPSA